MSDGKGRTDVVDAARLKDLADQLDSFDAEHSDFRALLEAVLDLPDEDVCQHVLELLIHNEGYGLSSGTVLRWKTGKSAPSKYIRTIVVRDIHKIVVNRISQLK
jgi:hypothetical protein